MHFALVLSILLPMALSAPTFEELLALEIAPSAANFDWSPIDQLLTQQIADEAFPGCVALIGNQDGILYYQSHGSFTYGEKAPFSGGNPPVNNFTTWDMASLTKVLMTTTAVMTFYQRGELSLDWFVADEQLLGPAFGTHGKSAITVRNLLLHNAGFPADPSPGYWEPEFGCPATAKYFPPENFECQQLVYEAVLNQTLINPVGEVYLYSDLSMITMMYVVGKLARTLGYVNINELKESCLSAKGDFDPSSPTSDSIDQCYYLAYVNKYAILHSGMLNSTFLVSPTSWGKCAPTWNDTAGYSPDGSYRKHVLQGQVSDENAYAMGGISGHAGFFSNGMDVHKLLKRLMYASDNDPWINSTTVNTFTTIYNVTQSSRAYGWDTNNYQIRDYPGCGNFSQNTFMHTGYTGTQVCNDKDRQMYAILLTNRVYPYANADSEAAITNARILFSNAVVEIYDNTLSSLQ